MYFWDVKSLANDLKENKINQKEQFKYYLFTMLGMVIASHHLNGDNPLPTPILKWTAFSLEFIVTLLGIIWCYQANRQGDNKDFLIRIFCLTFPIGVRIFVITLTFYAIILLFGIVFSDQLLAILIIITQVIYFMWTRSYLFYISNVSSPSVNQK